MSLTTHLEDRTSPLRTFFTDRFQGVPILLADGRAQVRKNGEPTAKPQHQEYARVGTAIDYRLRYYFAAKAVETLVAAHGAALLNPGEIFWYGGPCTVEPPPIRSKEEEIVGRAPGKKAVREFFSALQELPATLPFVGARLSEEQERLLARYCYGLALFEEVYRSGQVPAPLEHLGRRAGLSEVLALAPDAVVDDLCGLSWSFYEASSNLLGRPFELNPRFDGSVDVGGADADLIVDRILLEVKSTIDPVRNLACAVRQLLGYALLDYTDRYRIRGLGVYFARQACLVSWPVEEALNVLTGGAERSLPPLRNALVKVLDALDPAAEGRRREFTRQLDRLRDREDATR